MVAACSRRRTGVGELGLRFAVARLRRRDPSIARDRGAAHDLDLLLGAGTGLAAVESDVAAAADVGDPVGADPGRSPGRAPPTSDDGLAPLAALRAGHAMIRPTVGFLSRGARQRMAAADEGLLFAHSDVSGLSLFEEAHDTGVRAADRALQHL